MNLNLHQLYSEKMKTVRIVSADGEALATFNLPERFDEVRLAQMIDILKASEAIAHEASQPKPSYSAIINRMAQGVADFYGVDKQTIMNAVLSTAKTASQEAEPSHTIEALYIYAINIATNYTPNGALLKSEAFVWNSNTYMLPKSTIDAITAEAIPTSAITTAQAIEALEVSRILSEFDDNDPDGNYLYNYYLTLCALFLRKKDEALPLNASDLEAFISERKIEFKDIPAYVALELDFFLMAIYLPYAKEKTAIGSLSSLLFALALEIQKEFRQKSRRAMQPKPEQKKSSRKQGGALFTSN